MPPALPPRNTSAPTGQLDRTDNGVDARASPDREPEPWRRRRHLERQLHDGASLRISALALRLGLLRGQAPADEVTWRDTIAEVQDQLHAVLQELREVERQLYPPALDEAGLDPALRELADRYGTRLELDIEGSRFGRQVEGAAYFAVADWLDCRGPGRPERLGSPSGGSSRTWCSRCPRSRLSSWRGSGCTPSRWVVGKHGRTGRSG